MQVLFCGISHGHPTGGLRLRGGQKAGVCGGLALSFHGVMGACDRCNLMPGVSFLQDSAAEQLFRYHDLKV